MEPKYTIQRQNGTNSSLLTDFHRRLWLNKLDLANCILLSSPDIESQNTPYNGKMEND